MLFQEPSFRFIAEFLLTVRWKFPVYFTIMLDCSTGNLDLSAIWVAVCAGLQCCQVFFLSAECFSSSQFLVTCSVCFLHVLLCSSCFPRSAVLTSDKCHIQGVRLPYSYFWLMLTKSEQNEMGFLLTLTFCSEDLLSLEAFS